jgi:hypothetical protein
VCEVEGQCVHISVKQDVEPGQTAGRDSFHCPLLERLEQTQGQLSGASAPLPGQSVQQWQEQAGGRRWGRGHAQHEKGLGEKQLLLQSLSCLIQAQAGFHQVKGDFPPGFIVHMWPFNL